MHRAPLPALRVCELLALLESGAQLPDRVGAGSTRGQADQTGWEARCGRRLSLEERLAAAYFSFHAIDSIANGGALRRFRLERMFMQRLVIGIATWVAGFAMMLMVAIHGVALAAPVSDALAVDTGDPSPVVADSALDAGADAATKAAAATTVLALTSSLAFVVSPSAVTLTTTISGGTLKGNVTFKSGAATLGTAVINKAAAVLSVVLAPGVHSLTATFGAGSSEIVSPPLPVVVDNALGCS